MDGTDRHLQLGGQLGCGHPAAVLQQEEQGQEPVGAHGAIVDRGAGIHDRRCQVCRTGCSGAGGNEPPGREPGGTPCPPVPPPAVSPSPTGRRSRSAHRTPPRGSPAPRSSTPSRGGIEAAATRAGYTITYTGEAIGSYTGLELLSGSVDGREGAFVLEQRGTFDAGGTRCTFEVVAGSGSGELAGLSGSGGFTYRHGDTSVAYEFRYTVA
ncbi:DUF3224 domain-containing protein [Streptomyces vinaceus]|uniref:DUF3224 domain-containing protein n=1 Tax=Streptomyces vinaceus TaxID=1960 RepID=UPI0037FF6F99